MTSDDKRVCLRVIYHGCVQGVGFRWTTQRIASRYAVCGFVRNQTDGTVELVASGDSLELRRFLNDLAETMSGRITEAEESRCETSEEFDGFSIRR